MALIPLTFTSVSEPVPTYTPVSEPYEYVIMSTTTQKSVDATTTQPQTTDAVVEAILEVFPDAPIMVEVARCESNLNPLADRENRNVDVGLFQINQVHLERLSSLGLDRRDIDDNLAYAKMLYNESGLQPWYMSEHCWSRHLS